jgi:hypothetical protein
MIFSEPLTEGLRANDLEDLVLPLLSVDEFESKIDDDAIVFGFYVSEQDAAEDLNRFLQKSAADLIDTDVSPAPDSQGFFMVFVEMTRTDKTAAAMADILADVDEIAGTSDWNMNVRGQSDLVAFSEKNLLKILKSGQRSQRDNIYDFFQPSTLSKVVVEGRTVAIQASHSRVPNYVFDLIFFGRASDSLKLMEMLEKPVKLAESDVAQCNRYSRVIGPGFFVDVVEDQIVISAEHTQNVLILKHD